VSSGLDEYAYMFREAVRIAADGTSQDELVDWAQACWEGATDLRLVEADGLGFAGSAPPEVAALTRELYESFVVFSGVTRVADLLSLPLASCANGETLAPLIRERSPFAEWYTTATGTPFAPREVPSSLVRPNWRDKSPLAVYAGPRRQLAANADRESDEESDEPRAQRRLNEVFAERLVDAIGVYAEAVARARAVSSSDAAVGDLRTWTTAAARHAAPVLIGFARLSERRQAGLDPPAGAPAVARSVADGLVTLAAAESAEDFATLPCADPTDIAELARPFGKWFAQSGTV
jgi:hypothetical protein